jgi:3-phenylpropionate/cinnamic acid dioxygenase small subunit
MTLIDQTTSTAAVSADEYTQICQFLAREARLLDQNRLWEWFELLAEDFRSEVPIRVTLPRAASEKDHLAEFKTGVYHAQDTKGSARVRIQRLFSGYAWAEDPPSRTVRSVGSVEATARGSGGEYEVWSALLLYRERGLEPDHQFISANRTDVLRRTSTDLEIVDRKVWLAHTIVDTPNLGLFL